MTLEDLRAREVRATFDLARAPLVRARIARVDVDDHALILTAHHLVCDGWSVGVLLNDLAALYNGAALEPAPAFRDYAALRAATPLDEAAMEEAFWLDRKSTRLNSSHVKISYAVFCLKKKNVNN